jgi:hypothetical protein
MLSAAKDLDANPERPFAKRRVTRCDWSNGQGLFFTSEPYLKFIKHSHTSAEELTGPSEEAWELYDESGGSTGCLAILI